jgi:AcrR family transcriptional regulator
MTLAKKPRSRANDPAAMRSRILDAAASLFHRNGYAETSMQDVIRAARVTGGALHHHYPTKKALGLAVIRERIARTVEQVWIAPIEEGEDTLDGVRRAFAGILDGLDDAPIAGCPLNNLALELASAEPEFRAEIQAVFERWQDALAQRIAAEGLERPAAGISPAELATFIVASYSGAMTLAKSAQSSAPLNVALKVLTRVCADARS